MCTVGGNRNTKIESDPNTRRTCKLHVEKLFVQPQSIYILVILIIAPPCGPVWNFMPLLNKADCSGLVPGSDWSHRQDTLCLHTLQLFGPLSSVSVCVQSCLTLWHQVNSE